MFLTNTSKRILEKALSEGKEQLSNAERAVFERCDKEYISEHGYSILDAQFIAEMNEWNKRIWDTHFETREQYEQFGKELDEWLSNLTYEQDCMFCDCGYGEMFDMLGQCFR